MAVRKTLTEQVIDTLKEKIITEFKPGEKIPNEMILAEELSVSRTTIREAVKRLCSENYLEIRRGRGTYVCDNPGMDSDPLGYGSIDREQLYSDMLAVTLNLEPVLARMAAENADDIHIKKMESINKEFSEKLGQFRRGENQDVQQFRILDIKFHKAVIEGCCNTVVDRTLRAFLSDAVEWHEVWKGIDHEKVLDSCEKYHGMITEAIEEGNAELTYQLAQKHTQEIIDIYRSGQ